VRARLLIVIAACGSVVACGLFPESTFMLADTSRLPNWFHLAPGLLRPQVSVEMSYYVSPVYGGTAAFVLRRQDGTEIARVSGRCRGNHPIFLGPAATNPLHQYPSYEVITVNGQTEAIEHRAMQAIFYISDDPAVLAQLGLSK
jgi:hypothetical protein